MKKVFLLSICLFLCFSFTFSQEESNDVRSGNKLYKSNKFVDAEVAYRKGLAKNNESFEASFNLGNALYKQKKYPDAVKQFLKASTLDKDKSKLASAYHNIGNSFFQSKEYGKSIDAYKMALKQKPEDNQTRYNLAVAQKYLKQQQQQQNKKQNKEKKQPQKEQEKMSEENAKQLLESSIQDEKEVQNKVKENQQQQSKRPPVDKDW
jgi:Ca-activated chloride channel homolog